MTVSSMAIHVAPDGLANTLDQRCVERGSEVERCRELRRDHCEATMGWVRGAQTCKWSGGSGSSDSEGDAAEAYRSAGGRDV